jgi:hypothetical protein
MSNRDPLIDSEIVKRLIPAEDIEKGYILMEYNGLTGLYFRKDKGGGNMIVIRDGNDPFSIIEGYGDDVVMAGFIAFSKMKPPPFLS